MKLHTFWLVCCVGLLYSGGCVDGSSRNLEARRGHGGRWTTSASTNVNHPQAKATVRVTTHTFENPENWFIQTFTGSRVHLYPVRIIIPLNFVRTECPPWMTNVQICFIFYYHPETTTNKVPASTGLNDKISTTTQASEVTEIPGEEISIENRFGIKVNFNDYYNTKTGVDLKIVKPLRKPTITIPPADHSSGASESSRKKIPPSKESNEKINFVEPLSVYSTDTTTRRPTTTQNSTHRGIRRTTPPNNDDEEDPINFEDENTQKPRPLKRNTPTAARETSTTTSPLTPCTIGKTELTRNNQNYQNDPILFNNKEKGALSDLERAIQECCKRLSQQGCFDSKGFKFDKNPCEPILRQRWSLNL